MAAQEGTAKTTSTEETNALPFRCNAENIRKRVRSFIDKHQYESAIFWADKLVSLSDDLEDLFWYAQTMYLTGQYHRAIHLLTSRKLHKTYAACSFLAAKCHYQCKEWDQALEVLDLYGNPENKTITSLLNSDLNESSSVVMDDDKASLTIQNCENSIALLRGKIYEAMDNRNLAADCYKEALRLDVYCFEAFELLVSHHMLTAEEEKELIASLPFQSQCSPDEAELVKFLYETRLKKYDKPGSVAVPESLSPLADNLDVVISSAERHLYNCDFRTAYKITSKVLSVDPYNSQCLPIHIAVLVNLKKSNALFYIAHKLVDYYPDKAVSWFAVGCYYMLTENYIPARWYLSKATTLDRAHGPSWLAYGHTFGLNKEHDQAMAAYFTASQIMRGCHLPVLYIGLENGLTNNPKLAERFFNQALSIAPDDPFVLHEMGVVAFGNNEWKEAERCFLAALERIEAVGNEMLPEVWEPLVTNLGHVSRKLGKFQEALEYHRQAELLAPQTASTYSAIGFVYALMGDHSESVHYFHKALGLRKDDFISTSMLNNCMEALMSEMTPFDVCLEIPFFKRHNSEGSSSDRKTDEEDGGMVPLFVSRGGGGDDSGGEGEDDKSHRGGGGGGSATTTQEQNNALNESSLSIDEIDMEDCS